jgi:hypothetical protein
VGISFLLASIAFAQVTSGSATTNGSIAFSDISDLGPDAAAESSPNGAVETDRIIVTGSNIPTAEEVGANPVLTIGRELIDKSVNEPPQN